MTDITLCGTRVSPFVEKVAQALDYKGLSWQMRELKSPADLKKWNPVTGKMPTVEIDGEMVYDSTFILRRLEELQPDPSLFSEDPAAAAQQRLLEDWSDESLYWYLMALRWADRNKEATFQQISAGIPGFLKPIARIVITRKVGGMPATQGLGRLPYEVVVRETGKALDDLVLALAGRPFFFGDRPSVADFAVYGQICTGRSGPTPEFDELLSERSALVDLAKRVEDATSR